MTHFRFRYKRVGYMRWRCRAASRRTTSLTLPEVVVPYHAPSTAAWRRRVPATVLLLPVVTVLQVGSFVVSEEGDPQLSGHPGIRY
jgi:hypothetical protein